jgi:hypothetical protein
MPTVAYNFPIERSDLPISTTELVSRYFFGIGLTDQSGNPIDQKSIEFHIESAVEQLEGYLNLKLSKQIIEESLHYYVDDFTEWSYLPVSYPVLAAHEMMGLAAGQTQLTYPTDWISIKSTNDPTGAHRSFYLVPGSGGVGVSGSGSAVYAGILPLAGWMAGKSIPNYWRVKYCTSFQKLPADLADAAGKLASIGIFHQMGDIILGAGIASESVSIDGLSQSISTTSSATNAGYGARITGYLADLKLSLPRLKLKYDGMVIRSM